ncbi:MAG: LptF/LptG family permease [Sphaerochaetaceae bacterium]|nr:LptF/LptG family permease [Sphaerochaetaceae bacterium]
MKVFDRYLLSGFLRIFIVTLSLLSFILILFDTFSNLDRYLQYSSTLGQILWSSLLYVPEAVVFAFPPSALFASTFLLSTLHANNEMIILKNSGFSFVRIILPLLLTGLILSALQFSLNESLVVSSKNAKQEYMEELLSVDYSQDSKDVTLYSEDRLNVMHAKRYLSKEKQLNAVTLFRFDDEGELLFRLDSSSAQYNDPSWIFRQAVIYTIKEDHVDVKRLDKIVLDDILIPITVFENRTNEISTLPLDSALSYVEAVRKSGSSEYFSVASQTYDRIFRNFSPFILLLISCSTVFPWKKNILLLSIITSISIAVIYYVLLLAGSILSSQQVIKPLYGSAGPLVLLALISSLSLALQKN